MKKTIIISLVVVVVLVLAVLFFPVYQGSYDDGGTREYQALTYKLVVWNKLVDVVDSNGEADTGICEKVSVFWYPDSQKSIDELWEMALADK